MGTTQVAIRSTSIDISLLERQAICKLMSHLLQIGQLQHRYLVSNHHCFWILTKQRDTIMVQGESVIETWTLLGEQLLQQDFLSLSTEVDDHETKIIAKWCG